MSLRARLVLSVALSLLVALALGAMLLGWRATSSVQVEMRAALLGAEDVVQESLARQGGAPDRAVLSELVRSFNGQRHIRAVLFSPSGTLLAQSRLATSQGIAPPWFDTLIRAEPQTVRVVLPPHGNAGGVLMLQTDPTNEIAEVWKQAEDAFAIMLLFCGATFVTIYLIVGRALRFFSKFDASLRAVADGHYEASVPENGPPEFASLARGFNAMAEHLRVYRRKNGDLQEQIVTVQEEERAEIARDLHDEVGTYLFAIHVDADAIPRLAQDTAAIAERATAIRDAVTHVQKHIKAILRQLRPAGVLDFGLRAAIDDLVGFWARRHPRTRFDLDIVLDDSDIDRRSEEVVYRIVQESISNAIRHGRPTAIGIAIRQTSREISVTITDNGSGLHAMPPREGMGLAGMAERVQALNGRLEIADGADGRGVKVSVVLPLRAAVRREAETAS